MKAARAQGVILVLSADGALHAAGAQALSFNLARIAIIITVMILYVGADHRGYQLKEALKEYLGEAGYTLHDMGNTVYDESDDYVDFARLVAEEVSKDVSGRRGILACGSGVGVDIVANRFPQIRCALATFAEQAAESRSDDDANVLALAADFTDIETAKRIVSVWLQTPFSGEERHRRRIEKIRALGVPRL